MIQKVIITKDANEINQYLANGWRVVSVTAQSVAAHEYGKVEDCKGKFCFVLEGSLNAKEL